MRKIGFFRTNRLPVSNELAGYHAWPSPELLGWATEVLRRDRYVAVDDGLSRHFHSSSTPQQIWVPAAEADRWVEATRALVERVKEILRQEREALTRLNPATTPLRRRILWMVRHASGSARMRKEYQSVGAQLYCEMARAYQTYDEQAADLADHINADIERRKQKARREQEAQRRRELREREQRAAALGGPEDAVWACRVADSGDWRRIEVWVPALDERPPGSRRPPLLTNATAREVQAEIERERAEHPYTAVHWSLKTAQAMRERQGNQYGDEDATWEELTGQRIERYPIRPGDGRGSRRTGAHGPSSTYGSDYGAGGDYGGGYGGGGDYGGGGYGGGFGGSF